jgi:hypothetical protein
METKDIVVAIFGAAVGLAGILLVFVGFVYSRAETMDIARTREKFRRIAKSGIVPFLVSLLCSALCLRWMLVPSVVTFCWVRYSFYVCLVLTTLYGVVAFVFYL